MNKPIELTVAIDDDANECLYVNGHVWGNTGETTVYACYLAEAAGGNPVILTHVAGNRVAGEWPETLAELLGKEALTP